ncbi:MAG: HIRAN domain-containing protein [Clostridium sp.]
MFKFLSRLFGRNVEKQKVYFENELYTKVVGVTFEGRQRLVPKCRSGSKLRLVREKNNPYDENAIAVYNGLEQIGYIRRELAMELAKKIDSGTICNAYVSEVTGGYNGKSYGVNILLQY